MKQCNLKFIIEVKWLPTALKRKGPLRELKTEVTAVSVEHAMDGEKQSESVTKEKNSLDDVKLGHSSSKISKSSKSNNALSMLTEYADDNENGSEDDDDCDENGDGGGEGIPQKQPPVEARVERETDTSSSFSSSSSSRSLTFSDFAPGMKIYCVER